MTLQQITEHLDEKAREVIAIFPQLEGQFYFAGGCIYSLYNDREPKDYDCFLYDLSAKPYLDLCKAWNFTSEYALTTGKFQIVIKYYGEPPEVVGQFDFRHNMYWYVPLVNNEIQTANLWFGCYLESNELIFNNSRARDIEGVFLRIDKFIKRGMYISDATIAEIERRTSPERVAQYKKQRKYEYAKAR